MVWFSFTFFLQTNQWSIYLIEMPETINLDYNFNWDRSDDSICPSIFLHAKAHRMLQLWVRWAQNTLIKMIQSKWANNAILLAAHISLPWELYENGKNVQTHTDTDTHHTTCYT